MHPHYAPVNEEKGKIFFHIADIIEKTRPIAFFLENVDRIVTHNKGETFKKIIETLNIRLGYHIIGVELSEEGEPLYKPKDFVRNSRDFGVPQNRPRTYLIGFDTDFKSFLKPDSAKSLAREARKQNIIFSLLYQGFKFFAG